MRAYTKLLLILMLVISILCGCSIVPDQTVSCGELTITLPGHYMDLSEEDYAAGMEFLYGFNDTAVLAIREDKAELAELVPGIDAQQYAELFVETNSLLDTVDITDGIPNFTYTMDSNGTSITYLCTVFESSNYFWVVQAYCPTTSFAKNQEDLWGYLATVTIA